MGKLLHFNDHINNTKNLGYQPLDKNKWRLFLSME